jgi:hypothetical protein
VLSAGASGGGDSSDAGAEDGVRQLGAGSREPGAEKRLAGGAVGGKAVSEKLLASDF